MRGIASIVIVALTGSAACDVHVSRGGGNPAEYDVRLAQEQTKDNSATIGAESTREILKLDARPMMDALNELGVRNVDDAAVRVLVSAWQGANAQEPSLNWGAMDRTDVRFALANQLVRAHVNGSAGIPVANIAEFARPYLSGQHDEGSRIRAMYLVVFAGDVGDIERVKSLLLEKTSQTTFRAGMSALASVCAPEAANAIDDVRRRSQNSDYVEIVDEVLAKSAPFRARRCSR